MGTIFFGSFWIGEKLLIQRFFGLVDGLPLERITQSQWSKLNLVWVLFFIGAGLLNIYVAYNFSEATWVNFKVFGLMGLAIAFALAQVPMMNRYRLSEAND